MKLITTSVCSLALLAAVNAATRPVRPIDHGKREPKGIPTLRPDGLKERPKPEKPTELKRPKPEPFVRPKPSADKKPVKPVIDSFGRIPADKVTDSCITYGRKIKKFSYPEIQPCPAKPVEFIAPVGKPKHVCLDSLKYKVGKKSAAVPVDHCLSVKASDPSGRVRFMPADSPGYLQEWKMDDDDNLTIDDDAMADYCIGIRRGYSRGRFELKKCPRPVGAPEPCTPEDEDLTGYKPYEAQIGYWIGETQVRAAADEFGRGKGFYEMEEDVDICADGSEFHPVDNRCASKRKYIPWNFDTTDHKEFIRISVEDDQIIKRTVGVYRPSKPEKCAERGDATAGHPGTTTGVCGVNGAERMDKQTFEYAVDCKGNTAGKFDMTGSKLAMAMPGPGRKRRDADESAWGYVKTSMISEDMFLTTGTFMDKRFFTCLFEYDRSDDPAKDMMTRRRITTHFDPVSGKTVKGAFSIQKKVTHEAWMAALEAERIIANVEKDDMCGHDRRGKKFANPDCFEALGFKDDVSPKLPCNRLNGGDASRCDA